MAWQSVIKKRNFSILQIIAIRSFGGSTLDSMI